MARKFGRTQRCGPSEARQRLGHAKRLLEQITPGGKGAASQLRQLIDLKDAAHYGFLSVSVPQLKRALRQARSLVDFADGVLRR